MLLSAPTATLAAPKDRDAGAAPSVACDGAFRSDFEMFLAKGMERFPAIPALSIAVVHEDRPVVVTAHGWADREARHRASIATRFYIASSTKSFVALAFARLAERNAVSLDWTLAGLAPGIAFASGTNPDQVTLRHLLSHSHGLKGDALQFRLAYSGDWSESTLWRLLGSLTPNTKAPLGTFSYSNLGYNLAALLIEQRLNRSWQGIVEREVIAPLGLRETAARGLSSPADRALPYDGTQRLYLRKTDATMQSAGGMESSARDMAKWIAANLAAARGAARDLSAAMRGTHAAFVPTEASYGPFTRSQYGLGWYSGAYEGNQLFHSFGGFPGFRAHASFVPTQNLGVAAMSNDDGPGFWFVDIAAAYAYDWYRAGLDAANRMAETRMAELETKLAKSASSKKVRTPISLSRPSAVYIGRYCNADWGTIVVAPQAQDLSARMGALHAVLSGDGSDAVLAELVPGQRVRITFRVMDGRVAALEAFGATFLACDDAQT